MSHARSASFAFQLTTPATTGAIAAIHVSGDVGAALRALGAGDAPTGQVRLRRLADVDTGLVARWSDASATITCHGGMVVVRRLLETLAAAGGASDGLNARTAFPEAADDVEALMLETLARAESPLAIDLLLDQPRRWREWSAHPAPDAGAPDRWRLLDRLVTAPVVAAVGRPNVGKSTLVNALADRSVSIVSEEPGTTRDHVGVTLNLGGLVIHWLDTPGLRMEGDEAPAVEDEAAAAARLAMASADLLVLCGDAEHGFVSEADLPVEAPDRVIRVGTRCDLGRPAGAEYGTAAGRGEEGLPELATAIRERLVPAQAVAHSGPWAFHPALRARLAKGFEGI